MLSVFLLWLAEFFKPSEMFQVHRNKENKIPIQRPKLGKRIFFFFFATRTEPRRKEIERQQ